MQAERQALSDVLFLLTVAGEQNIAGLNRTAIQRFLFLTAAVCPLAGFEWGYGFTNGRFGPFNRFVSRAADRLVLKGLCEFKDFDVKEDGSIRAIYQATAAGQAEAVRITKIDAERRRCEWIKAVVTAMDIYGPAVITKLASREPSYADMRARNQNGLIDFYSSGNPSVTLIDTLGHHLKERFDISIESLMEKLTLYFDFLSSDLVRAR